MKFAETLHNQCRPKWRTYNIHYDDIKEYIKTETSPEHNRAITVPGCTNERLDHVENALFIVLTEDYERLLLFVKVQHNEIRGRLDQAVEQTRRLHQLSSATRDRRTLEEERRSFDVLENELREAGKQARCLSRFIVRHRTAFEKLLKSYKKRTGSPSLEQRFRIQSRLEAANFLNFDLVLTLDRFSKVVKDVCQLYDSRVKVPEPSVSDAMFASSPLVSVTMVQLQQCLESGLRQDFDTAVGSIPLGDASSITSYFVPPSDVLEMYMLLLQHTQRYPAKEIVSSGFLSSRPVSTPKGMTHPTDFFVLAADNLDRFVHEQITSATDDHDCSIGSSPQRLTACARWNERQQEQAQVALRSWSDKVQCAPIKQKHALAFLDASKPFIWNGQSFPVANEADKSSRDVRHRLEQDPEVRPLFAMATHRSRFRGLNNNRDGGVYVTLDLNISFRHPSDPISESPISFPFAVVTVRQEGEDSGTLIRAIDASYVAEKVKNFSLEHHGVWAVCKPETLPEPPWIPILSQDISKFDPNDASPRSTRARALSLQGSKSSTSSPPDSDITSPSEASSGTKMVNIPFIFTPEILGHSPQSSRSNSMIYPPLAQVTRQPPPSQTQLRYWNEYDHPEDGDSADDPFLIGVDHDQPSWIDRLCERIGQFFTCSDSLPDDDHLDSTATGRVDDSDSSDDETENAPLRVQRQPSNPGSIGGTTTSYGTIAPVLMES